MREHVRLGRVAGVDVGINWSVLAIFLLITVGLAGGRFPLLFPDLNPAVYVAAGLVAGAVFLLSLLAHELAHAVVARHHGVAVDGITLWLFGGVARLDGEPPDARADLRIAGVGPLVSVVLSGAFYGMALGLSAAGLPGIVVDVCVWLSVINLVLAGFNLVPAAPLDGGRILRAFLWWRRGDRTSAAVTAARAGRGFGWLLVGLGMLLVLVVGFTGLWLMLIGWFLASAAAAEEQQARVSSALADVRVADVMSASPTTVPAATTVDVFVRDYVFAHHHSTFPVVRDEPGRGEPDRDVRPEGGEEPVGLVTLRRVKQVPEAERATTTVQAVACALADVPVVGPDEPLAELLPRMTGCADGRALVVAGGRLVGLVSPSDVMRQLEIAELRSPRHDHRI